MNLAVIRNLDRMQELGYPVLLGTSRKSVIGLTLDLPADQREEGTLATTVYGILHGCSFVRVHDVRANRRGDPDDGSNPKSRQILNANDTLDQGGSFYERSDHH